MIMKSASFPAMRFVEILSNMLQWMKIRFSCPAFYEFLALYSEDRVLIADVRQSSSSDRGNWQSSKPKDYFEDKLIDARHLLAHLVAASLFIQ